MTDYKDYYDILGVPRTATAEEIRSAFRKKAREYHPDVAKDKIQGAEKFKEVNEAYEVLSDPAKRAKYDQMGREAPGGGFAWQGRPGGRGRRTWRSFILAEPDTAIFSSIFLGAWVATVVSGDLPAGGWPGGVPTSRET